MLHWSLRQKFYVLGKFLHSTATSSSTGSQVGSHSKLSQNEPNGVASNESVCPVWFRVGDGYRLLSGHEACVARRVRRKRSSEVDGFELGESVLAFGKVG